MTGVEPFHSTFAFKDVPEVEELKNNLMIHELCHARHMNHSRRFWRRVGRFEPDYRRLDKSLGESWKVMPNWLGLH